jgi:hypothetical protein
MYKVERYVYCKFQIDTNRINSKERIHNMNQLEQWNLDGVIHIEMAAVAQKEAINKADSKRKEKAFSYIYSETLANTQEDRELLTKVETLLFSGGTKNQNQKNDVEIVFNADKYKCILITADGASKSQPGGILGHKTELKMLGIEVMTDEEAVAHVRKLILQRDKWAIENHEELKTPLPDWVGKD